MSLGGHEQIPRSLSKEVEESQREMCVHIGHYYVVYLWNCGSVFIFKSSTTFFKNRLFLLPFRLAITSTA